MKAVFPISGEGGLPLPRGKGYARLRRHIVPQPLAPLLSFLNAHPGVCCLAVTGAGGKTSLIADLTDIFAVSGRSCVIAPTTRIFVPPLRNRAPGTRPQENEHSPRPCDALLLRNGRPPDALAEELLALLRDPRRHGAPVCAAMGEDIEQSPAGRKLRGLPPGYVCRLKTLLERAFPPDSAPSPLLLAEADGAARLSRLTPLTNPSFPPALMPWPQSWGWTRWEKRWPKPSTALKSPQICWARNLTRPSPRPWPPLCFCIPPGRSGARLRTQRA